jgi:hypothetical protein
VGSIHADGGATRFPSLIFPSLASLPVRFSSR